MKPRNFAGKRARRVERTLARNLGWPAPRDEPHVTDIKVRMGAKKRAEIDPPPVKLPNDYIDPHNSNTRWSDIGL